MRRNPGVKQGYALIRGGGPTGMKMVVVSTHKTREGAETAMIKKGGTPNSLFTKGYSIFAFGPGTRYEYLDTEFTGKFLRPIVGNPAIPANMNNPKYVKVLKLAEMRARNFGEPFGVYAYEGMDGPTFIARKPGEWPERYGELVTLITPKGKRGLRGNRGLTPRQQKMLDFLKRVYPQYSELAKDSATKKDASRLARLKLIKVRSFKRTGTSRGKRFSMMIMEARAMAPKGGQLSSPYLGLARNPYVSKILGDMKSQQLKYRGFTIILERQPNTILATWTDGDTLQSQRYSGYSFREVYEVVKDEIDDLIKPSRPGMLRGNPYVVKEGKEVLGRFDNRREARDYLRATAWKFGNFGPSMPSDRRGAVARMMDSGTSDLDKRMARVASLKMRYVRANPPMYAHGMTAHRTHGLSLKQMMKLYRLVSSGNPKAVMYARRTLGIPMSESLSQVKAVVYHHVMDLKGKM